MGYPLFLAGFVKVLGLGRTSVTAMRVSSLLLATTWLAVQPRLLRDHMPASVAYVLPILFGVTPFTFQLSGQIMSEPLFCCLLLATVLVGESVLRRGGGTDRSLWARAAAAGALAAVAMVVRTIGMPLVVALPLCLALRRQWALAAVSLAASLVVLAPWIAWTALHAGGTFNTYAAESARSGIHPLLQALKMTTRSVPEMAFPPLVGRSLEGHVPRPLLLGVQLLVGLPVATLVLVGLARLVVTGSLVGVVALLNLGIIVCWWWEPGRFLMPIYPLLAIAGWVGLCRVKGAFRAVDWGCSAALSRRADVVLVVLIAGCCLYADLRRLEAVWRSHHWGGAGGAQQWAELWAARGAVERLTPRDAVLMTSWPDLMYLLTLRATVDQPVRGDRIPNVLAAVPAGRQLYVIGTERGNWTSPANEEYGLAGIADVEARRPGLLLTAWQADGGRVTVYRVDRAALATAR